MPADFLVADHDGTAVGYAIGAVVQDEPASAWVIRLSVGKPYRRQGTGRALILRLISGLAARGLNHIFLSVAKGNRPAHKIYRDAGFVTVGHRKGILVRARTGRSSGILSDSDTTASGALDSPPCF